MTYTSATGVPIAAGIELVSRRLLPDRFQSIFPFPYFNAIQSKCFSHVYSGQDNFVLSAPTGSGKTAVLELAICRFVISSLGAEAQRAKIIYQAPTKALCSERQRDWSRKFGQVGLQCEELTGDTEQAQLRHVQNADIIITTPEKWDSVTRKWRDHRKLMELIRLFLVDEVHILREDRGASLEAVVSRMKSVSKNVRFIALSATIPNNDDIAAWLGKNTDSHHLPASQQVFGEQFRPVLLQKHVLGFSSNAQSEFQFEQVCNNKLADVVARYTVGKPVMIFCFTRSSTEATAKALAHWWETSSPCERYWQAASSVPALQDPNLTNCISAGVAFHHAGVEQSDRTAVEGGFLNGLISVLCCTSTLAVGVNLPCHLVIIKNTVTYHTESGCCREYSDLDIMQMIGRAGRPQFDDQAIAVIMTRREKAPRYERMVQGQELLESRLHLNLIEHLNAEIGLGTISDLTTACRWLESTFLFVRLAKNPQHYQLAGDAPNKSLSERAKFICDRDLQRLLQYDLARGDKTFKSSEYGDAMARYYVSFDTMKLVMGLQERAKLSEILSAIAQSSELKCLRFKAGEKQMYKDINSDPMIKFPIKVNIDLPAHKVSLIIQAALSGINPRGDSRYKMHHRQFAMDTNLAFQHSKRLIRCIIDCKIEDKDAVALRNSLDLARSFGARAWDDSPFQLSQLEGIGPVAVRKLVSAGVRTIEELEDFEPHRIDMALSKNPPFGSMLLQKLKSFPKLRVSLKVIGKPYLVTSTDHVRVNIKAGLGFLNDTPPTHFNKTPINVHILAETSDGAYVHFARISARNLRQAQDIFFLVHIREPEQLINCYIACDDIAGTLKFAVLDPKIPASMFKRNSRGVPANVSKSKTSSIVSLDRSISPSSTAAPHDDFDDDDLDDNDLIAASKHSTQQEPEYFDIDDFFSDDDQPTRKNKPVLSGQGKQRAPASEKAWSSTTRGQTANDKAAVAARTPSNSQLSHDQNSIQAKDWHPEKLPNGKWRCSHTCKDRHKCRHTCCKEGSDKPPRGPPKARTDDHEYEQSSIMKDFLRRNKSQASTSKANDRTLAVTPNAKDNISPVTTTTAAATKRKGNVEFRLAGALPRSPRSGEARPASTSTSYGDNVFEDDDAADADLGAHLDALPSPRLETFNVPLGCRQSPDKGRSLFLYESSSPAKPAAVAVAVAADDEEMDAMPLIKRRRLMSRGAVVTLRELEAETTPHHPLTSASASTIEANTLGTNRSSSRSPARHALSCGPSVARHHHNRLLHDSRSNNMISQQSPPQAAARPPNPMDARHEVELSTPRARPTAHATPPETISNAAWPPRRTISHRDDEPQHHHDSDFRAQTGRYESQTLSQLPVLPFHESCFDGAPHAPTTEMSAADGARSADSCADDPEAVTQPDSIDPKEWVLAMFGAVVDVME